MNGELIKSVKPKKKTKWKKYLLIVLVLILVSAILFLFGSSYYVVNQMSKHRVEKLETTPEKLGLSSKTLELMSKDGIPLKAWLIPNENSKGVVIILHGMHGVDASCFLGHAKFLFDAGYTPIVLDMRAHGRSGGDRISFAFKEPNDVCAVLDWLNQSEEYKDLPRVLFGISMGGATAIRTAGLREDVDAVISISGFASTIKVTQDIFDMDGVPKSVRKIIMPFVRLSFTLMFKVIPSKASPLNDISKIPPRPILIAHGTEDEQVSVENAKMLYDAVGKKAELWLVEGAKHFIFKGDATGPEDEFYRKKILEFLSESII